MKAGRGALAERAALRSARECKGETAQTLADLRACIYTWSFAVAGSRVENDTCTLPCAVPLGICIWFVCLREREREIRMRKQRSMPRLSLREGEKRSASRTRGATVRAGMQEKKCKLLATSNARVYTCRITLALLRLLLSRLQEEIARG